MEVNRDVVHQESERKREEICDSDREVGWRYWGLYLDLRLELLFEPLDRVVRLHVEVQCR